MRNSVRVSQNGTMVPARPSAAKNDERREGMRGERFELGIGSAIKISCPSYLGPNWFFLICISDTNKCVMKKCVILLKFLVLCTLFIT